MTRTQRATLAVILLSAAVLRLTGLDWDGFQHHHPDERYITWVATTIEFPSPRGVDWDAQLRPETSTFNPFHWPPGASSEGIVVLDGQPRDFAYGHLPLYFGVAATRLIERLSPYLLPLLPPEWSLTADVLNGEGRIEFHHLAAVGRALTALFDVGTVYFLFLLGRRLFSASIGLLAAALLSLTVLHIQLAHFFTSDPFMTFFVVAALYFLTSGQVIGRQSSLPDHRGGAIYLMAAAAMVGLAVGSKFTAVLLLLPLLWVAWSLGAGKRMWLMPAALGVAFLVFGFTNPFALLDWSCTPAPSSGPLAGWLELLFRSCYAQNVMTQNAMVSGRIDLAFTRQYTGTRPYVYFFEMMLRWGMGPILGMLGLGGLIWAVWQVVRSAKDESPPGGIVNRLGAQPLFTLLLWVVPYLLLTGGFYVKFLRYMQPAIPLLLLFGSAMIMSWGNVTGRRVAATLALASGMLYAVAFVSIYRQEHPWNAASRWIYETVPPGTLILSEQYDDYLPASMTLDGQQRIRSEYPNAELTWLAGPDAADDEAKLMDNLELLAQAEYVTILSNRIYGVVPRLPERYPLSSEYYQLLFDGALGYELVWVGDRSPTLLGVSARPDTFGWPRLRPPKGVADFWSEQPGLMLGRADESFLVYDQPLTLIFRNTGKLTARQMRAEFENLAGN